MVTQTTRISRLQPMAKIQFNNKRLTSEPGKTVLDTLLDNGIDIPFSCRQGSCQSCMVRSLDTTPPAKSQEGLKETLKAQNYFLACQCRPETDMNVVPAGETELSISASVEQLNLLNPETLQLRLKHHSSFTYRPGQFVRVKRHDGLFRNYSIANLPDEENLLEFHIRKLPNGSFSEWAHSELEVGNELTLEGPLGNCFYLSGNPEQPLLMVCTGTGLAPMAGILHDALDKGHCGPIHLFHGSRELSGLYWIDEMRELADKHANFNYFPCLSGESNPEGFHQGRAHQQALELIPNLAGWRLFLCGHPEMVNETRKKAFLAGASLQDIHADPFTLSPQ